MISYSLISYSSIGVLIDSVVRALERPSVTLMINKDRLHDAYIVRAVTSGKIEQQYIYMHEIENAGTIQGTVDLFYSRSRHAISTLLPEEVPMQGASEYDDIMQAQTIMDELKP